MLEWCGANVQILGCQTNSSKLANSTTRSPPKPVPRHRSRRRRRRLPDHMRWLIERAPSLLRRLDSKNTTARPLSAATADSSISDDLSLSAAADPSISDEISLSDQIISILHTVPSIAPPLDCLAPLLTPHVVSTVLHDTPSPRLAFRFFAWAAAHRRLRSWPAHNRIISLLRDTDSGLSSAWDTLSHLKAQSLAIPPPAFTVLITASSTPDKAIEAFAQMRHFGCHPDTFTYNTILQLMVNAGVGILAMAVYSQMLKSADRPNRATYIILIDFLTKTGKVDDAFQLFAEMLNRGISPNTTIYTVFLSAQCKSDKINEASKLFREMREKGYKPDTYTYNVMLNGFCKSGRVDEALKHLASFREDGYILDLPGYNCLIDGLVRCRRFDEARWYYNKMLEKEVAPDCIFYTIMIRGYMKAGRLDDAVAILSEMTERGVVPDTFCYNTLIKGFCDARLLDRARTLKLEISRNGGFPDSATYTIMICGLCKEGLVNEAQQIFDEMGNLGCFPTVMTFNALINGLCKTGKLKEAFIVFHKMEMGKNPYLFLRLSQGVSRVQDSTSLHKKVEELCETGEFVKAYKLLHGIIESGVMPNIVTYNILINGLCKVDNLDWALKLLKELQVKGHSPDAITYRTLISALCKVRNFDLALKLLKELQFKGHSLDTFTYQTLVDGLFKFSREKDAEREFQNMMISGCSPSFLNYSNYMRLLCMEKKVSQAVILWLDYISKERMIPREADTIGVVRKNFEQGNMEEAIRALVEMERQRGFLNSFPYTIWIVGYCKAGKADEALKIFSILSEFNVDANLPSCVHLINRLCLQGKLAPALDVMIYALRKDFRLERPVVNRLITSLCMQSKKDALELACRMRLAGYDMDMHLRASTKALLYNLRDSGS